MSRNSPLPMMKPLEYRVNRPTLRSLALLGGPLLGTSGDTRQHTRMEVRLRREEKKWDWNSGVPRRSLVACASDLPALACASKSLMGSDGLAAPTPAGPRAAELFGRHTAVPLSDEEGETQQAIGVSSSSRTELVLTSRTPRPREDTTKAPLPAAATRSDTLWIDASSAQVRRRG